MQCTRAEPPFSDTLSTKGTSHHPPPNGLACFDSVTPYHKYPKSHSPTSAHTDEGKVHLSGLLQPGMMRIETLDGKGSASMLWLRFGWIFFLSFFLLLFPWSGCGEGGKCTDRISLGTIDPHDSTCSQHCECNNQYYEGFCHNGKCISPGRGACDIARRQEPCTLQQQFSGVQDSIADQSDHIIAKIDSSGNFTSFAGTGIIGNKDGTRTTAQFNGPHGVALDAKGNVYVADTYNQKIRKIDVQTNTVSTIAGTGTQGNKDGPAMQATFTSPSRLLIAGNKLYIAEDHAIRVLIPPP